MATTNLFFDPAFKDGAFTANDPQVRAYALQKTMQAIDLGVELGAQVYVFWGGREGTETDASKNPLDSLKRFREALNFLCGYVIDQGYDLRFALEAKPNEPRGDIFLPTTGAMLGFIATLDHSEMVGVNPEVAHEHMAGLNFMHAVAQAWESGKLFHIDLNDQAFGRYDQDFRFGAVNLKSAFFLVKFLEDVAYPATAISMHMPTALKITRVKEFACKVRTYLILGESRSVNADSEIQALLKEIKSSMQREAPDHSYQPARASEGRGFRPAGVGERVGVWPLINSPSSCYWAFDRWPSDCQTVASLLSPSPLPINVHANATMTSQKLLGIDVLQRG
jgi:xylose isomerase